ncbi:MAG: MraY family glycosyltransferase [Gemmatimonadaceae bacterium]
MQELLRHLIAVAVGYAVSYLLIPRIIKVAERRMILDFPTSTRHQHLTAVPRLGGIALVAALLASSVVLYAYDFFRVGEVHIPDSYIGVIAGVLVVFATGLADDLYDLPPRMKLLGQTIGAFFVVGFASSPPNIFWGETFAGLPVEVVATPIYLLWIIGVTNAFNLIDGMDGLASIAGLIGLTVCVGLDVFAGNGASADLALATTAAVIAFLRFNRHPARIFLGDSGSMLLGFLLSIWLVQSATDREGRVHTIVPLFALALPLLDTAIAIVRRWLRGDPFSKADGRHVHHQILALGLSPRTTLELLGFFFGGVAVVGISIAFAPPRFSVTLMVAAAAVLFTTFCYGMRWLRYHEFTALSNSLSSVVRNARFAVREKIRADEVADRLQSARDLDEVRELVGSLVGSRLLDIELLESTHDVHSHGPSRQRISSYDALPIRFDYPFALTGSGETREMVLRIWCPRPGTAGPTHTAERVASRVGPALEQWFRARGEREVQISGGTDGGATGSRERVLAMRVSVDSPPPR